MNRFILFGIILIALTGCAKQATDNTAATEFCNIEDVGAVYVCGENIKVVSNLAGAGSTFYKADGSELRCPVVAPDSMSEECKQLVFDENCEEIC